MLAPQLRSEIATVPKAPHGSPAIVVLMGLPGVGKSHCARLLCARLGAAHVASDELRSRLFIAASYGDDENRAIFGAAQALVDQLIGEGHRVVIDATNLLERNRAWIAEVVTKRAVPVTYVLVTSTDANARARLATRRSARAADDHSEADERIYERMRAQPFEQPSTGHLEIVNGPDLDHEIARVAERVGVATR